MSIKRALRRFRQSREGAILVFVGISVAIFLGFVALSFDLGRVASTQSELQSFADNVALAAAGELDGGDTACTRAKAAAANLISDTQTFATDDHTLVGDAGAADCSAETLGDYTITFLDELPADDDTPLGSCASCVTTKPSAAVYAWVQVNQHTVDMPIASAFSVLTGGTSQSAGIGAEAVAGFSAYACDITPMFFCLPSADYTPDAHIGDMILMRSGGGGAGWGPGNFGWLNTGNVDEAALIGGPCEGENSEIQRTACQLAASKNRSACFVQGGVITKPGQSNGNLATAFNVIFDMFDANAKKLMDDPDFAPAPNVVQGKIVSRNGGNCTVTDSTDTVPLPWDTEFAAPTCQQDDLNLNTRFGSGDIDWTNYIDKNHGNGDGSIEATEWPAGTDASSTRYEMYLAEIAAAATSTDPILPGRSETGRPQCSSVVSPDPDRRIIVAAGVDCSGANGPSGQSELPVKEFFKLFLTHPVGVGPAGCSNTGFDIWAEVVGSAGASGSGNEGVFHDVVQLYR